MNRVERDRICFDPEGVTAIKMANAAGSTVERFRFTKSKTNYTRTRVQ